MMKKINEKNDGIIVVLAVCGILAPVIYFFQLLFLGLFTPGYSHASDMMSILGGVGGLRGFAFNTGVALTGLLVAAFAIGLHFNLNYGKGSIASPFLFVLAGVGLVGAGFFSCDLGCENVLSYTFTGIAHSLFSALSGICISVAPLVMYPRIRRDPRWEYYKSFTLGCGIFANLMGIGFWISFMFFREELDSIVGILQRLGIAIPLLWIGVMAVKMLVLTRKAVSSSD
ncbi:MAG: DUF998 domain-containing protein [Candidatus Odinarchaeota archaeon]